jgi:hypothetical protein
MKPFSLCHSQLLISSTSCIIQREEEKREKARGRSKPYADRETDVAVSSIKVQ